METDGVIHATFDHDFSRFAQNADVDRRAIEAIGAALAGSDRSFVATAGLPLIPGRITTEDDAAPATGGSPRVSEQATSALVGRGVRVMVVRMSQAHDRARQGLASYLIEVARAKGVSAYMGDGRNRWSAVHCLDAARLYRLALEKSIAGARYHAVTEEGVSLRAIAEAIGQALRLPVTTLPPEQAGDHFGWLALPASMDAPASSDLTQQRLGWRPTEKCGIIADLDSAGAVST